MLHDHTSTEQPEALRLADIVERLNVGVHSQAIAEEYSAAAAELRRLHERDMRADVQIKELLQVIEDLERSAGMLSQRVQELEAELAAAQQGVREAVLQEREACAKACEGMEANRDWVPGSLWGNIRSEMAAAIRARGEPEQPALPYHPAMMSEIIN